MNTSDVTYAPPKLGVEDYEWLTAHGFSSNGGYLPKPKKSKRHKDRKVGKKPMVYIDTVARYVSPADVMKGMSERGGFTQARLYQWGVPWPPPHGWRYALEHNLTLSEAVAQLDGPPFAVHE